MNKLATATEIKVVGTDRRLKILDGWRAMSIVMVLAGHWLPIGPKSLNLNAPVAAGGMAIFFTLSGFLITRFLLDRPEPLPFLIRRLLRILPLGWLAMVVLYFSSSNSLAQLVGNLMFTANLPPARLLHAGNHLWSLCVEMQFYVGVAVLVALAGRRGLLLLPIFALSVTLGRIFDRAPISIITWFRVDEILAGAIVALIYSNSFGKAPVELMKRCNFYVVAAIAALCTFDLDGPFAYARPYAIALMVGVSLWNAPAWMRSLLGSKAAAYIASISYAVYVVHGMLTATWFGTGDTFVKYAKRPLLIGATWALAHLSTYYYEQRFIELGRQVTTQRRRAP